MIRKIGSSDFFFRFLKKSLSLFPMVFDKNPTHFIPAKKMKFHYPLYTHIYICMYIYIGVIHIWSPLWGGQGRGVRWKWDVIGCREVRVSECSGRPIFFFIKEKWLYTMTRHHANNILLARNLRFDSDVRDSSQLLMIPLHCFTIGWLKYFNEKVILFIAIWFWM